MKNIDAYNVCLLIFPFNSPQAGGEFGSVCFMMCYTGTAETVTRAVFRTRAIYGIMWTRHGISLPPSDSSRRIRGG